MALVTGDVVDQCDYLHFVTIVNNVPYFPLFLFKFSFVFGVLSSSSIVKDSE